MSLILSKIKNNPLKIVDNTIKQLTVKIHDNYKKSVSGELIVPEFNELDFEIQHNNYKQTHLILKFLKELKYEVVDIEDKREGISYFDDKEKEYLAKREHNAWYLRKLSEGYVYGEEKKDKENPKVVPWDELDIDYQNPNLNTMEQLPASCKEVGLKIIKTK